MGQGKNDVVSPGVRSGGFLYSLALSRETGYSTRIFLGIRPFVGRKSTSPLKHLRERTGKNNLSND